MLIILMLAMNYAMSSARVVWMGHAGGVNRAC
jgi:hypothetical protein